MFLQRVGRCLRVVVVQAVMGTHCGLFWACSCIGADCDIDEISRGYHGLGQLAVSSISQLEPM
jgi:hypothetical protein